MGHFVAGDWGTSNLRLFLCDDSGAVLETVTGPGAADSQGQFERVFDSLVDAKWAGQSLESPAVLCGMVGSTIGWIEARYLPCPARPEDIATACATLRDGRIRIIPGLSCRNRFDAPDVMRGEETQILGAMELQPALREGRHLLCLPGTHTKWVMLEDGAVIEFLTTPAGELFTLLRDRSVLVRERGSTPDPSAPAFKLGLAQVDRFPQAQILHRLFECRSRSLAGELAPPDVASFLSGLLIGSDIAGVLGIFANSTVVHSVHLIGSPQLMDLYAAGLGSQYYETSRTDGDLAAVAGLAQVRRQLTRGSMTNAN